MEKENNDGPNMVKYSIWDTRTEENPDVTKEKFAEALEQSTLKSKTTDHRD
jgi:hypothetical protein